LGNKALIIIVGILAIVGVGSAQLGAVPSVAIQNVENFAFGGGDMPDVALGGTTNFDNLALSDGLNITGGVVTSSAVLGLSTTTKVTGALITGGSPITLASTGVVTVDTAEACSGSDILYGFTGSGSSTAEVTLPASTTLGAACLDASGKGIQFIFRNTESLTASTVTIVAGTGIDLETVSTTPADAIIDGGQSVSIILKRLGSVVYAYMTEFIDAD